MVLIVFPLMTQQKLLVGKILTCSFPPPNHYDLPSTSPTYTVQVTDLLFLISISDLRCTLTYTLMHVCQWFPTV